MNASDVENLETLRSQLKQLQQEKESWKKYKDERDALKIELESIKNSNASKEKKSRHSADFWVDVGDKLKNDTDAIKELIKNKTITNEDVDPDGYSLLSLAAYYGLNSLSHPYRIDI